MLARASIVLQSYTRIVLAEKIEVDSFYTPTHVLKITLSCAQLTQLLLGILIIFISNHCGNCYRKRQFSGQILCNTTKRRRVTANMHVFGNEKWSGG
jgi:hypothetical protein